MKKLLILLLLSSILFMCMFHNMRMKAHIETLSLNTSIINEVFDDGNCGELGYCPAPLEFQ